MEQPVTSPDSTVGPDQAATEDDLRRVCELLGKSWDSTFGSLTSLEMGRADQDLDADRFMIVYAYAAHAQMLTVSACEHLVGLDYVVAGPLLRVAYESALTAVWAADSKEAERAIHYALVKSVGNLRTSALKTKWFESIICHASENALATSANAGRQGACTRLGLVDRDDGSASRRALDRFGAVDRRLLGFVCLA